MAARMDPDIENLEEFIRVLTDSISKMGESQPELEAHGEALEKLNQDAGEELGGFDRDLDGELPDLDKLADQAQAELEKLETTAQEGDDGVLSEARESFQEWEGTLGRTLDQAAEGVNSASGDLARDGFDALGQTLQSAISAVDDAQSATESAFERLHSALKDEAGRFTGSLVSAALEAQEAAEQAGTLESAFDAKSSAAIEAVGTASGAARGVHAETGSGAGTFYDGVEGKAQSETQDLISGVKDAFAKAAESMREVAESPLQEPADSLVTDALDPFAAEADNWSGQENATDQTLQSWPTLMKDLEASLEVFRQIDALSKAMD